MFLKRINGTLLVGLSQKVSNFLKMIQSKNRMAFRSTLIYNREWSDVPVNGYDIKDKLSPVSFNWRQGYLRVCSSEKVTSIYFLRFSIVWSMLHDRSVWRVHKKNCYLMLLCTFLVFFCCFFCFFFHHKICFYHFYFFFW